MTRSRERKECTGHRSLSRSEGKVKTTIDRSKQYYEKDQKHPSFHEDVPLVFEVNALGRCGREDLVSVKLSEDFDMGMPFDGLGLTRRK